MGIEWNSGGDILEDGVDLPCGNLQELWSVTIFWEVYKSPTHREIGWPQGPENQVWFMACNIYIYIHLSP